MKFVLLLLLISFAYPIYSQNHCEDFLLLDGNERILTMGMDTTNNWWAITEPFSNKKRLYVNKWVSEPYFLIKEPTFSPTGGKWATFAYDNVNWYLVTENDVIQLNCTDPGEIHFSYNGVLIYSYLQNNIEFAIHGDKQIQIMGRVSKFYTDPQARFLAFVYGNSSGKILVWRGRQTPIFEDILPVGFWQDGDFVYVGTNGSNSQIYKGTESFFKYFDKYKSPTINAFGNVLAFIGIANNGQHTAVLHSDEYYEPLMSRQYDNISDLLLHPIDALFAFKANYNSREMFVLNSTEYWAGDISGKANMSFDGSELFYLGCTTNCFVVINGLQLRLGQDLPVETVFAKKPTSNTIAYSTSSAMVVRKIDGKEIFAGMMLEYLINPRYNRFTDRYEALGVVNQRLYMITCKF